MVYIVFALFAITVFSIGALVGIKDCKKLYNIPKGLPETLHKEENPEGVTDGDVNS